MNCTKCGNSIAVGLKFCTYCGTAVGASPPPPASNEPASGPTAPSCAKCGAPLKPGLRFCTACGARVELASAPEARPDDKTAEVPQTIPPAAAIHEPPAAEVAVPAVKALPESVEIPSEIKQVKDGPRCPECGAAMMPRARFCMACGARFQHSKAAAPPPQPRSDEAAERPRATEPAEAVPSGAAAEVRPPASADAEVTSSSEVELAPAPEVPAAVDPVPAVEATGAIEEVAAPVPPAPDAPAEAPAPVVPAAPSTAGVCAKCGAQLSAGLRFCTACGAAVAPPAEEDVSDVNAVQAAPPSTKDTAGIDEKPPETPPSTAETPEDMTGTAFAGPETPAEEPEPGPTAATLASGVCAKCGAQLSPGVRFCIGCGAPVEAQAAAAVAAAPAATQGTAASTSRVPPAASAPAPIQRKGLSAGVLVAIFLVLLVVVAGCAFWLLRSLRFSPVTEVAVTEIQTESEDATAEPAGSATPDPGLAAEDTGQPAGTAVGSLDTSPAEGTSLAEPSVSAGAASSARAGGAGSEASRSPAPATPPPPAARKSTPAPTVVKKSVQSAQNTAPSARTSVPFVDDPAPSAAVQSGTAPAAGTAASPPATTPVAPPAPAPVQPAAPAAPSEGIIYWTGRLQKGKRFIISTKGTDYGFADGKLLPGTPVEVRVLSPAVKVVEAPGPGNSWQRIILECTRNTNQSVTVNVQWFAAR